MIKCKMCGADLILTQDGNEYFAERIDKWKVGTLFNSKFAVLIGIIIVLAGASLNLIKNSW